MRLASAVSIVALIAAPVHADDAMPHPLPLHIGDHGVIEAHIVEVSESGADPFHESERTETDIDYEYTAEGDGYRITATLVRYERLWNGHPVTTTGSEAQKILIRAMYPATYVADAKLTPVRIENWNAVKARIDIATDDIVQVFTDRDGAEMGETQGAGLKAGFDALTQQSALSWYDRAKLTRTGNGYPVMVRNLPILTRQDSDWPLDGQNVKVKIEEVSTLSQWDPALGLAHIVSDRTTTPIDVTAEMLAELAKGPRRYVDYDKVWVIHDRCEVDITLATGLASKTTCHRDDGYAPDPGEDISNTTVITLTLGQ